MEQGACISCSFQLCYRWPIGSSISSFLCVSPQSWRPGAELIMPAHLFSLSIVQGWVGGQLFFCQCKHTSYVCSDVAVILGTSTTSSMWSMFVHHVVWWPNMAVIKYSIKYNLVWYRWPIDSSISSCLCVSPQLWHPGAELIMPAHPFSLPIVQGGLVGSFFQCKHVVRAYCM